MVIGSGIIIGGKFRIERPVSHAGGTAAVYLASLTDNPKLKVAVKFAKSDSTGPMPEDMLLDREADLLSRWNWRHPGIVRIYPIPLDEREVAYSRKAVELTGRPTFMVLEYLSGGSLAENFKKIRDFPLGWKLETFYQILVAVSHLHQMGFGHRDLKPENIVFRDSISPKLIPNPVLVDFALASNGKDQYMIVEKAFTASYASPERYLRNMGYDVPPYPLEEDIWSLGVILYEIITGIHLFRGNEDSVRTTIIKGNINPDIDEKYADNNSYTAKKLSSIIRYMLGPDPRDRPSIKQLVLALEELFPPPRLTL
ncbi:protein kinase domain-containing protein [Anaerolinea sp.]|uniref:protein kinase domain-containing protein n=1 Tax=Anaerolinea sp. TaxID=1872519 RepID=UPI002ACE8AA3|nr:protein kinase [Anaerolinea sp.]